MTGYDLNKMYVDILKEIYVLNDYCDNNTDTALLTNDEVQDIIKNLRFGLTLIEFELKKLKCEVDNDS